MLVMGDCDSAVYGLLGGITNLAIDQEDFLMDLISRG